MQLFEKTGPDTDILLITRHSGAAIIAALLAILAAAVVNACPPVTAITLPHPTRAAIRCLYGSSRPDQHRNQQQNRY